MKQYIFISLFAAAALTACGPDEPAFDASGAFEADEVIVAAEAGGRILSLDVQEGDTLSAGAVVGAIDAEGLELQKAQLEASAAALRDRTTSAEPQVRVLEQQLQVQKSQVAAQRAQLATLERERTRIANLVKAEAATAKQLDDITGQIDVLREQIGAAEAQLGVLRQQIRAQREQVALQNRAVLSEEAPTAKRIEQVADQIDRARIVNPVPGTVLLSYAEPGEVTSPGKALYKIADLRELTLRAYVTADQLAAVKIGQPVEVLVDDGAEGYRSYTGTLSWIADKAEFTPRTILTKDERANQVYDTKIRVPNDGYLRIGMYGEVRFKGQGAKGNDQPANAER